MTWETDPEKRLVRVPMPVALIREMDEALVAGVGGFSTREEFISEAVRDKLLEISYPPAGPGPGDPASGGSVGAAPHVSRPAGSLEATVVRPPARPVATLDGELAVADAVILGLHNRDYASIWALARVAEFAVDGPVDARGCLGEVVRQAWAFAEALPAEAKGPFKLGSLFPKNRAKAQSAAEQFRNFAIGAIRSRDGELYGDGPLFTWRALQARVADGRTEIGLTADGVALLDGLDGLSLALPHNEAHARFFLAYLARTAPTDLAAMRLAVDGARGGLTRVELIAAFTRAYPEWSSAQATSNTQGYVARGREWGLIEPKLVDGHYQATALGAEFARDGLDARDAEVAAA